MEVDTFDSIEAQKGQRKSKKYKNLSEIGYGDRVEVKVYRGDVSALIFFLRLLVSLFFSVSVWRTDKGNLL